MAVAQMAAGSCGGTFGTFQGCQTAVSKCNENKWLWLETLRVAAAELLEHLRAAKRQSQKPVNPDGCGPNGSWEQHGTAAKRKLRRPVTFHTSGGPRRHPCLGIGRGRRIYTHMRVCIDIILDYVVLVCLLFWGLLFFSTHGYLTAMMGHDGN